VWWQGEEAAAAAAAAAAAVPVGGGEVRIVAPLGAPRSPASSPTMTASLVPLMAPADTGPVDTVTGLDNNLNNMASFETTTHFEETTTRYGLQYTR